MSGEEKLQKRFYEKWWFWLLAFFIVSIVITSQNEGNRHLSENLMPQDKKVEDSQVKEKSIPTIDTTSDSGTYIIHLLNWMLTR